MTRRVVVIRLSKQDVREARQASRHLPNNDYDAQRLLAAIRRQGRRSMRDQ